MLRRVQELTPPAPEPAPAVGPLPEASFSVTLRGTMGGQDAMLTVRGQTVAEFQHNLQAVRGLLDAPQAPAPPPPTAPPLHTTVVDWCNVHQVAMKWNAGKEGRKGWYSHRTAEGAWCKGKGVTRG
jgi:hypothetical protein